LVFQSLETKKGLLENNINKNNFRFLQVIYMYMKESCFWFCKFKIPKKDSLGGKKKSFFWTFSKSRARWQAKKWWRQKGKLIRSLPSPPSPKPSSQQKRKRKQKSANEHDNEQKHHECTLYTTYLDCILMLAWSWYKELKKITWKLEREKNLKTISAWAMCLNKNEKAMCLRNTKKTK
jgi:hypothetical protein